MINQIWDTLLTLSHLAYTRLSAEQSFEPGSMEKKSHDKFPLFTKLKTNSFETNVKDLHQYILTSCDEFNRGYFFMLVQAAILIYCPSVALSIVYQEYQTEVLQQEMQEIQDQYEDEQIEQDDMFQRLPSTQSCIKRMSMIQEQEMTQMTQQPFIKQFVQFIQQMIVQLTQSPLQQQQCMMQYIDQSQQLQFVQQDRSMNINNCQYQKQPFLQQMQCYQQQQQQRYHQQRPATQKAATLNNENEADKITVVIKVELPGEGRQGQPADGRNTKVVYQTYIIKF